MAISPIRVFHDVLGPGIILDHIIGMGGELYLVKFDRYAAPEFVPAHELSPQ